MMAELAFFAELAVLSFQDESAHPYFQFRFLFYHVGYGLARLDSNQFSSNYGI